MAKKRGKRGNGGRRPASGVPLTARERAQIPEQIRLAKAELRRLERRSEIWGKRPLTEFPGERETSNPSLLEFLQDMRETEGTASVAKALGKPAPTVRRWLSQKKIDRGALDSVKRMVYHYLLDRISIPELEFRGTDVSQALGLALRHVYTLWHSPIAE